VWQMIKNNAEVTTEYKITAREIKTS
jgi:hypothetical protein